MVRARSVYRVIEKGHTISLVVTGNDEAQDGPVVVGRAIDAAGVEQSGVPEDDVTRVAGEFHRGDIADCGVSELSIFICTIRTDGAAVSGVAIRVDHVMRARPDCEAATTRGYLVHENHR